MINATSWPWTLEETAGQQGHGRTLAGSWQGSSTCPTSLPLRDHFPGGFYHTENWDLASINSQESRIRRASQAAMAWAQHCWGQAEQRGTSGQCHSTGTRANPALVAPTGHPQGQAWWGLSRGHVGQSRFAGQCWQRPLSAPILFAQEEEQVQTGPRGTRDTNAPWQGQHPAWLGGPTAARLTGMGCPRPATSRMALNPECQDG